MSPRWSAWSNGRCTDFLHWACRMAGYWQLPVMQQSRQTAFSPIRNLAVSQHAFCLQVPYHLMNKVCHGLPFVTVYCDDIRIHSTTVTQCEEHLLFVFHHTWEEALHWVAPCCLPWTHLSLRHGTWSSDLCCKGVAHSRSVSDLCSFHRLALHYRRYILGFAEIAELPQWNLRCLCLLPMLTQIKKCIYRVVMATTEQQIYRSLCTWCAKDRPVFLCMLCTKRKRTPNINIHV